MLIALAIPLGRYMTGVMDGSSVVVRRIGRPIEAVLYKLAGVDPQAEMSWKHYALAVLAFNALGALAVYGFLRLQQWLPANPQGFGPMTPDGAFNTAVSFVTNTNWQDYTPEATVSYLTQMAGLDRAELPVGRHGHRRRRRVDSRLRASYGGNHRQLLGRPDAHHALCARAARRRDRRSSSSARA